MATVTSVEDAPKAGFCTVEGDSKEKKSKLPKPSAYTLTPEDLFAYMKTLSEQDWAHTSVYMYRHWPIIVRDPSNIDTPSGPIDEQYILDNHGSGRYEVKLNDADTGKTICHTFPDYNNPAFPPKFDIRELDPFHKKNRLIVEKLKREGKMTQDGDVVTAVKGDSADATMADALKSIALEAMRGRKPEGGMENQAFGKMMEMMASASKQSIEIALGQVKKDDPASFLALLTTAKTLFSPTETKAADPLDILSKAKEIFAPKSDDSMTKLLMSQLEQAQKDASAERQRNHELQLKMLEAKADAADPMDMVEKVLNIQEKLGGGQDGRNWKEKLVDQGFQALPDILNAVKGMAYQRGNPPRSNQPQPAQSQAQPQMQPQSQQQPSPNPQGAETVQPQPPQDPDIAMLLPILEQQGMRLVNAFKADPACGADVAAAIASPLLAGPAGYERIARMGRDKILATIDLIPQMKADLLAIGTQEMINDFIDDIIAGPDDDEDDDDDDGPVIPEGNKQPRKPRAPKVAVA